jgi:flavin reductase (DIM6/NTAB) family NADH-FMN oxidoreductase RutF
MAIDKAQFRQVLGNFPAGVTVVTLTGPENKPYGLTATAFTSVSLLPPMVLVCVDKKTDSHPHFVPGGAFVVNLLAQDQQDVSQRFATRAIDKFAGVEWKIGALGAPVLAGTIGHMECRVAHSYDGGDHTIFVGEIESAAATDGQPLVYFRGAYRKVADLG